MTTGERIKEARLAAKMTQQELADKIGVKFSAIHKYEAGLVVNLKRDTIAAIADALDCSPAYLLGYTDIKNYPGDATTPETKEFYDEGAKDLHKYQLIKMNLSLFGGDSETPLSQDELDIIKIYRSLSPASQQKLLELTKMFQAAEDNKK